MKSVRHLANWIGLNQDFSAMHLIDQSLETDVTWIMKFVRHLANWIGLNQDFFRNALNWPEFTNWKEMKLVTCVSTL